MAKNDNAAEEVKSVAKKKVNKQDFTKRKLQVLNQKSGAKFERAASRVVVNNKGV